MSDDEKCDRSNLKSFFFVFLRLVVYSSPFSGRTYNLDYLSRFNFNSDAPATTSKPAPHPHHFKHMLNWDINWNFNHGSKTANKADDSKPTEATTVATERPVEASTKASSSSSSYNGQIGHKKIDVKWSLDFNHGGSASTSSSSTEKPRTVDESDAKPTDEDNDIDPTSNLDE